jgi:hypothetical protein
MADSPNAPGLNSPSPDRVNITLPGQGEAPLSDIRRGFTSAYVFELQDLRETDPAFMIHVLALNPTRYTLSEPFQVTLTPTEDNTVVAEENGQIVRELTIEGTTGLSDKRGAAFDGDQGPLSGTEHFLHLRNMFRRYSRIKQRPRDAAHVRMVFHSLRDDDHFVVVPRSFETPRDARTTRVHYEYRITLAIIADADNTLRPLDLSDDFDFFADELAAVAGAFNDARGAFAEITAELSLIKRKVGNIQSVMLQAAGMINAVGNAFRAAGDLILYPFQLANSVRETIDRAQDNLVNSLRDSTVGTEARISREIRRMSEALDGVAANPQLFGPSPLDDVQETYQGLRSATGEDVARREAGAGISTRTVNSIGTGREAGLELGTYEGVARISVTRVDTITSLAARFGSSAELIILINNLRFPYIAEGGGPGILKPGDVILIPVGEAQGDRGLQPEGEHLTADEAMYGVDMALDPVLLQDNRLEIRPHGNGLDADLSRGLNNVIQGTEITLRTERGSTVFVPEVGIRRSVGVKGTIQHLIMTALHLREGILADPRIEGIQDSTVVLEGDVLTQEISPRLIGQSDVKIVLPLGRASGASGTSFSGG